MFTTKLLHIFETFILIIRIVTVYGYYLEVGFVKFGLKIYDVTNTCLNIRTVVTHKDNKY